MKRKVLILGGTGMLGHKAWQIFQSYFDTYVTVRDNLAKYERYGLFDKRHTIENMDAFKFQRVAQLIRKLRPDTVLNCIGIVKQLLEADDPLISIEVNALFPHRLAKVCNGLDIRLIHISTDCVFSGRKGGYTEESQSDAQDLYGRTKFLGEVSYGKALTLRTSIIGRELNSQHGLLEWFLSQEGKKVKGYRKAIYSGFTTQALCGIVLDIIERYKGLKGLYNVSSEPIDKFSLLSLIKDVYRLNIGIERYEDFVCDRSLDSTKFRMVTGCIPPTWREMIVDMHNDSTPHNIWRAKDDF